MSTSSSLEFATVITDLLQLARVTEQVRGVRSINAGANNRTYCVETEGARFFVKHYFQHIFDQRDRLETEYSFLSYAYSIAPDYVPKPITKNPNTGMALYEYIPGKSINYGEVGQNEVDAAIDFFKILNQPELRLTATSIPPASDSAFTLIEHARTVDYRIEQLLQIEPVDEIDFQGVIFINSMAIFWKELRSNLMIEAKRLGWDPEYILPLEQRCLSPSDFGFHNAIRTAEGSIRFIDFEYAGWDDPAKTVADFFAQPAVSVPTDYYDDFFKGIQQLFADEDLFLLRTHLLKPVHQIKWCCIALNVFQDVHMSRRKFSNPTLNEQGIKNNQLIKAKNIFYTVKEPNYGLY